MATGTILLSIPPSGMDSTSPPGMLYENNQWHLLLDATADELFYHSFRCPTNYSSAFVLKARYKMDSATSGNVQLKCAIRATADGEDPASSGFDTDNTSGAVAVPATAELEDEISITLTNADAIVAGESMTVRVSRDPTHANDTATGDMKLLGLALEYTTA